MTIAYETRAKLAANGYDCIPLIGKRPALPGWQKKIGAAAADFNYWDLQLSKASNTGLNGVRTPGLDLDIVNPEAAATAGDAVRDWFDGRGIILTRIGQAPKRLIPFRTSSRFNKIVRVFRDPADKSPAPKPQRIEILGDGQQFVVSGVHPDTGKPYSWHADRSPETTPRDELPEITETVARELVDYLATMLMEKYGFEEIAVSETCSAAPNGHDTNGSPFDPEACLLSMKPDAASVEEVQRRVIISRLQRGHYPQDILDDVVEHTMKVADAAGLGWSRDVEVKAVSARICTQFRYATAKWAGGMPSWLPGAFHVGWMRVEAQGLKPILMHRGDGWLIRREGRDTGGENGDAGEHVETAAETKRNAGGTKPRILTLNWFEPADVAKHPQREWLYGRHYQRQTVSLTAGPGGMGKSSLDLVEGISMATCRNLLGEQPEERLRVWFHNGDDPLDETLRRVFAICQHYGIPQEELREHLCLTSGNEFPLRVARGYTNLEIDTGLVQQISDAIGEKGLDLVIFDPLVTMHSVSEMDPGKMDAVIRLFAGIADEHNAAIELAHHVRKPAPGSAGDYDVHDIRGVQAITDAVRAARILNRMNTKDAEAAGCDEAQRLLRFRVDRAKGNYSPAQAATWRQLVSIEIANGDAVGVVAPWEFPGQGEPTPEKALADRRADEVFLHLLDKFNARGITVGTKGGPNYAPSLFAEEREARGAKVSKAALKAAMARLLDGGRVKLESAGRGDRSTRWLVLGQEP
jgi:RecA-family ATPase